MTHADVVLLAGIFKDIGFPKSTKSFDPSNLRTDGSHIVLFPAHPLTESEGSVKTEPREPLLAFVVKSVHVVSISVLSAELPSPFKFDARRLNTNPPLDDELELLLELDDDEDEEDELLNAPDEELELLLDDELELLLDELDDELLLDELELEDELPELEDEELEELLDELLLELDELELLEELELDEELLLDELVHRFAKHTCPPVQSAVKQQFPVTQSPEHTI